MPRRALIGLIVALAAGALVGNGLAGLSSPLPNDACLDDGSRPEGSTSGGSVELWPLGRRCEYRVGSRLAQTTHLGPTPAQLYAWIVAVTLLGGLALLRRDSAVVRGAATATALLGLVGAGWHYGGVQFAFWGTLVPGMPVAFAVDHVLRPRGRRSPRRSLGLAVALVPLTFCAIFAVIFIPVVGIAFDVIAGAAASAAVARAHDAPAAAA